MALSQYLAELNDVVPGTPVREAVSSRRLNAIMGAIRALVRGENISSGPGVTVTQNGSAGVSVGSTARTGAAAAGLTHPFKLTDVSITDPPTAKITVSYGTLNDIPLGPSAGTITLADGATNTVYLDVVINDVGAVTAVTLSVGASGKPADTDYHAYVTLAEPIVGTGTITDLQQAVTHSLRFYACARDMTVPTPGTYQFWGL